MEEWQVTWEGHGPASIEDGQIVMRLPTITHVPTRNTFSSVVIRIPAEAGFVQGMWNLGSSSLTVEVIEADPKRLVVVAGFAPAR